MSSHRSVARLLSALFATVALFAACGSSSTATTAGTASTIPTDTSASKPAASLRISSIPDQDPAKVAARDGAMAEYLRAKLGVSVEVVPVTDYAASVSLFKAGDLDLVFYGGLTGVQARLRSPGSVLIAQRDVDDAFRSVFIANASAGVAPVSGIDGLKTLAGKRFTFGSESSTSGRLMPQYFLDKAGLDAEKDFAGPAGFSGSHDKTVDLVQSGTYQAGALNLQVWKSRIEKGTVDTTKVVEVFVTPSYRDYHWLASAGMTQRFGAGFTDKVKAAILGLDGADSTQAPVLQAYGAKSFIPTTAENYTEIEAIGRKLQLIN